MDIGLMVEGQHGLNWERWGRILASAERLQFPTLFRSDHFFLSPQAQQDSLDTYLSFVMAAAETSTIRFGPLVTPITFRHPANLGRMAAQIDLLSNGRFVMGLGAGWNAGEHEAYGLDFPGVGERFDRLEEALQVIQKLWREDSADYEGRFYQLKGANCLPKPAAGRPPILIGGGGEKRTLRLVAEVAEEWNVPGMPVEAYAAKCEVLERHCEAVGRDPATIKRSMMSFGIVGPNPEHVQEVLASIGLGGMGASPAATIGGSTEQVVELLGQFGELGLQEVEFQHFDFDSDEVLEYLAAEVVPQVRDL